MTAAPPSGAAPRRPRRRWWFLLVAIGFGLGVALVAVELGFRWLWQMPIAFAEFEQAGLYVQTAGGAIGLQPGYRGTLQVGAAGRTQVVVNSLGMRGDEVAAKRPGERRVLVVGDSLVFGYGVEDGAALPAQLQRELGGLGKPATVGNAGVPSFGSRDAVAALQAHDAPFAADAFVVCGYLGNDAVDDLRVDRAVCGGLRFDGPMARLVQSSWRVRLAVHSRAMLWFEAWVFTNHPTWSPLLQQAPSAEELQSLRGLPGTYPTFAPTFAGLFLDVADATKTWQAGTPPVIPRVLDNLRSSLQRAKAAAGARPLVYVVLPTLWQVDEARRLAKLGELQFDPAQFPRGTAQRRWLDVAKELGIAAFDATPLLAADPAPQGLFLADGGHFSERGNQLVARWLAQQLVPLLP